MSRDQKEMSTCSDLSQIQTEIVRFRHQRNWEQFHTPKNLALSLVLEATELMEIFQWLDYDEELSVLKTRKETIKEEMADVLNYLLLMAHDFDIDLVEATREKLQINAVKYPVEKSFNNHLKYTEIGNEH